MTDKSIFKEAKKRNPNQREFILRILRDAGDNGILNKDLVKICIGYRSRIAELYQMGYKINCENIKQGICKYTLIEEPIVPIKNKPSAIDILKETIDKTLNGAVSSENLEELLNKLNLNVVRKAGSHKVLNNY